MEEEQEECDLGGGNKDCENCVYYPDYKWNEEKGYCERNEEVD